MTTETMKRIEGLIARADAILAKPVPAPTKPQPEAAMTPSGLQRLKRIIDRLDGLTPQIPLETTTSRSEEPEMPDAEDLAKSVLKFYEQYKKASE